eukprot:515784-Ditylum_brightwellii.AAC.1
MDNTYLLGQFNTVTPTVSVHKDQLKEVDMDLNETKTACYIRPQHHNNRHRCVLGTINEGMLQTQEGTPEYSIKVYRMPACDDNYVREALSQKVENQK